MENTLFTREYDGRRLPDMHVPRPAYKPQSPKQRGIQPDKTRAAQNQWFTKTEAAQHCVALTQRAMRKIGKDWRDYRIVEPSAGDGRFYNLLPATRRIGLDLSPQTNSKASSGIIKHDFLRWSPPETGKYIVIGNPPFGVRGDLADAFIKRACLFADICAFILPIGYMNTQRSYFPGFELIHSEELPSDIFVNVLGHESKPAGQGAINTCFNIWSAGNSPRPPVYDYVCQKDVRVSACNFPKNADAFIRAHGLFVKARYYGRTQISERFDDVRSRNSYYVVGFGTQSRERQREYFNKIKQVDWRNYQTKAMNGSFSITLKNARRALYDIGLAHPVTRNPQPNA